MRNCEHRNCGNQATNSNNNNINAGRLTFCTGNIVQITLHNQIPIFSHKLPSLQRSTKVRSIKNLTIESETDGK